MLTAIQFVLDAVRYLVHGPSQVELDSVEPAE
jgi:hypothetical protein